MEDYTGQQYDRVHNPQEVNTNLSIHDVLATTTSKSIGLAYDTYKLQIEMGVAREQARNVLPLATYTEMYWKIDLHNLLHFLRLRLDSHAQKEIREFAQAIYDIVRDWVPITAQAFEDYVLYGVSLSRLEMEWIRQGLALVLIHDENTLIESFKSVGITNKREQQEFYAKLKPK